MYIKFAIILRKMSKLVLSEIWIYPIKSLSGIRVKSAKVQLKGLQYDRRWMLIDESGRFLTQREHPQMALLKISLHHDELGVIDKNGRKIDVPINHSDSRQKLKAQIWDDEVEVYEVSNKHNEWFSDAMGSRCKLVFFPESNNRPVDPDFALNQEHVSLADGYPYLIIGQSSLDDLNSRLIEPVPIHRFRPNFVFTGGEPFAEDNWRNFTIGKNRFAGLKPCARCVLITVDHITAKKSSEPLATLATYRKKGNKINFGQNVVAIDHYEIKEGDEIVVD
jgi:uncharacterized protein